MSSAGASAKYWFLASQRRSRFLFAAVLVLFSVWVWPLPYLGAPPFSAHMTMHMAVVAVASPLLALGLRGGRFDLAARAPRLFAAIPASLVELCAVWAWHAPLLHHAARHQRPAFVLEQGTFLFAGFLLWAAALGGSAEQRRTRAVAGVMGLLLTSMHMTLLGALIALTPRVLYTHEHSQHHATLAPLLDQQLGGAIMLLVGGVAYLAGGLGLSADAFLRDRRSEGDQ
jgi:putative membrane protein